MCGGKGRAWRAPTPRPRTPNGHAGSWLGSSFKPARFRHLNDAGRHAVARVIQDPWTPPARLPLRGARLDGCGIGPGGIECPQGSCLPKRRPHSPSTRRQPERRICRGLPLNVARPSPGARRRHISRSRSRSRRFGNFAKPLERIRGASRRSFPLGAGRLGSVTLQCHGTRVRVLDLFSFVKVARRRFPRGGRR